MSLDSNKQGEFVVEMARMVKILAERVQTHQVTAEQAILKMQQAVSTLETAAVACKSLKSAVATNIDTTIKTAMSGAGEKAAGILVEQFKTANDCAIEAADRYESAARTIGWRMAGAIALGCLVSIGASIYLVQGSFASLAEIHALREEKAQLQASIAGLEGRGARSISMCTYQQDRKFPCAYVATDLKTNKREWLFLATPK